MVDNSTLVAWGVALFSIFFSVFWLHVHFSDKRQKHNVPKVWPKVSIIAPAYNEGKNVAACIESLLKLDYPKDKLEIIVVDDGSKDDTYAIAKKYQSKIVKVLTQKNGGKASALNLGLKHATGEFVACMDADSITTPPVLKKLVAAFTSEKVGSITAAMKIHQPKTLIQKMQAIEYVLGIWIRKLMGTVDVIQATPGPFSLYRKSVLDKIGYFDVGNITEDGEMAMRLHYHKYSIGNVPDAYVGTVGPATLKGLYKQRLRWYKGLLRNSLQYREMMFKKEYGNFGQYYLPMIWISVFLLLVSVSLMSWRFVTVLANHIKTVMLVGLSYYVPDFSHFNLYQFLIGTNIIFLFPAMIMLLVGVHVLVYSYREANERMFSSIPIIFIYMFVYFMLLAFFWTVAFIEEVLGVDRKWN